MDINGSDGKKTEHHTIGRNLYAARKRDDWLLHCDRRFWPESRQQQPLDQRELQCERSDITATGTVAGLIDLNAYPAAFYYLAWTADVDESANTIAVKVMGSV